MSRRTRAGVVVASGFALLFAFAPPLFAKDGPAAPAQDTRAVYQRGMSEYNLGHFRSALESFEEVYRRSPLPALLFNIAQCHRQLREFEEAVTTYNAFIRTADPQNPNLASAKDLLVEVQAALKAQQHAQTVPPLGDAESKSAGPAKAPPGSAGGTQAPPGVALAQPGGSSARSAAAPSSAVQPAPTDAAPLPPPRQRLYSYVAAGAGVVALGAGVGFGISSKSAADDLTSSQHTKDEIATLQSQQKSRATAADVLFGVGAALVIAGGVLFVLHY